MPAQRQSLLNLHYAILASDTGDGAVYQTPRKLAGLISAKVNPSSSQEKLWADDSVADIASALGDITLEIELSSLALHDHGFLLGHSLGMGELVMRDFDEPPYVAVGFMTRYAPNRHRLVWLCKGKFSLVQDEYATATDAAAWRLPKLTGTFVKREYDGMWQAIADTGDPEFIAPIASWFKNVYGSTETLPPS